MTHSPRSIIPTTVHLASTNCTSRTAIELSTSDGWIKGKKTVLYTVLLDMGSPVSMV